MSRFFFRDCRFPMIYLYNPIMANIARNLEVHTHTHTHT